MKIHEPKLHHADALDVLPKLSGITLMYADVDYGLDVYPGDDGDGFEWLTLARAALLSGGILALSIHPGQAGAAMTSARFQGFTWLQTIIWRYYDQKGEYKHRLPPNHEQILVFTPLDWKTYTPGPDRSRVFRPERIMVPNRHPGNVTHRHGRRYVAGELRIPGDVWEIPRIVAQSHERMKKTEGCQANASRLSSEFSCQKPEELMRRLILLYTDPGDLVVDPRLGTGTTCVVARSLGRRSVGIERHPERFELAKQRLSRDWQPSLELEAA